MKSRRQRLITNLSDIIGISSLVVAIISSIGLITSTLTGIAGMNFFYFMAGSVVTTMACDAIQRKTTKGKLASFIHRPQSSHEYTPIKQPKSHPKARSQQELETNRQELLKILIDLYSTPDLTTQGHLSRHIKRYYLTIFPTHDTDLGQSMIAWLMEKHIDEKHPTQGGNKIIELLNEKQIDDPIVIGLIEKIDNKMVKTNQPKPM
ncbi:MAG: hypothetical protein CMF46_05175 [Legionellales bacterium]|nr:hypothetical protein [Legionellales bacterium]